ncbi:hypothetical protein QYF36_010927 [Acer negundo]|nr:hypothetical protein QYF36_010927 [Acer negundo]
MLEGENSKEKRALVNVPSEAYKQSDMAGDMRNLKMDTVMSQDQGSMSEVIVTQEATKWEGIVTEWTVINGPIDNKVFGAHVIAQKSDIDCRVSASLYGPLLDSDKRKFGRDFKLGISGEKFKVSSGKRKLDLVSKGDSARCKKIRKNYDGLIEVGNKDEDQLENA